MHLIDRNPLVPFSKGVVRMKCAGRMIVTCPAGSTARGEDQRFTDDEVGAKVWGA